MTWPKFKKSSSPEPMGQLRPNFAQNILVQRGLEFCFCLCVCVCEWGFFVWFFCVFFNLQIKDHLGLKKDILIFFVFLSTLWYSHSFAQMC